MLVGNYTPLPGETRQNVYPLEEMRVYDSLPAELRQAIASAETKVRPSVVAAALRRIAPAEIIDVMRDVQEESRPEYEAHCLATMGEAARKWKEAIARRPAA